MELLRRLLRWLNGRPDKVMYIGGSDTLPPPLPRQEEAERLRQELTGELSEGSCWPVRPSSSETCGWWCTSPAGLRTPASTSRT